MIMCFGTLALCRVCDYSIGPIDTVLNTQIQTPNSEPDPKLRTRPHVPFASPPNMLPWAQLFRKVQPVSLRLLSPGKVNFKHHIISHPYNSAAPEHNSNTFTADLHPYATFLSTSLAGLFRPGRCTPPVRGCVCQDIRAQATHHDSPFPSAILAPYSTFRDLEKIFICSQERERGRERERKTTKAANEKPGQGRQKGSTTRVPRPLSMGEKEGSTARLFYSE